jgi:trans-aconitate methyltransferase
MLNAALKLHHEPSLDLNPCPLCGGHSGELISEQVAGGHGIDTQTCHHCGAVYQPVSWSSEELMLAYEAEHLGDTQLLHVPTPEGTMAADAPEYDKVKSTLLTGRAHNALSLAYVQPGDRVLQLGCGAGETLVVQREALGIECCGVELSATLADLAAEQRIDVQVSSLDAPDFDFQELDVVEAFHFLQRIPDPLAWLQRCWDCLAVGGRIVVEVPNLYHPQGSLTEAFFRATHLHTWSESTLTALLTRAGFVVERVISTLTLFAVARKDDATPRDVAFSSALLTHPEHDCLWVATHLRNYDALEATRMQIRRDGPDLDKMHRLVHLLMKPTFETQVVNACLDLVEYFLNHRAVGLACLVATAASDGPYAAPLRERFAKLAEAIRADGVAIASASEDDDSTGESKNPVGPGEIADSGKPSPSLTGPVGLLVQRLKHDFFTPTMFRASQRPPFAPIASGVQA